MQKFNSKLIWLVVFILVVMVVYFSVSFKKDNSKKLDNVESSKLITLQEISIHNTKESCWTTINGQVFDITNFISKHKGGDKILAACGVDATDYFTGKHPTIGRVHSQVAVKLLESMNIGSLGRQ